MEDKKQEIMEVLEEVETEQEAKEGFFAKIGGFCKKHKKGLIIGGLAAAGAVVVAMIAKGKNADDYEEEFDCDEEDYIESECSEIE